MCIPQIHRLRRSSILLPFGGFAPLFTPSLCNRPRTRSRPRSLRVAAKKKYKISECGLEGRCLQRPKPANGSPPEKSRTSTSSRTIWLRLTSRLQPEQDRGISLEIFSVKVEHPSGLRLI